MKRPVMTCFWNGRIKKKTEGEKIELLYVISGSMKFRTEVQEYVLHVEDVALVDFGEKCEWELDKEGILVQISIDYFYICSQIPGMHPHFGCNLNSAEGEEKCNRLKEIIRKIAKEHIATERFTGVKYTAYAYQLLLFMTEELLDMKKTGIHKAYREDSRLSAMLEYVYMNYDQDISLTELASNLYMSISSLSRYFTKKMGMSFVEYVKKFRLQKVREDLRISSVSVTQIAVENGFSNSSSLNRSFREVYHITPSEYREQIKQELYEQKEKEEKNRKKILRRLSRMQDDITTNLKGNQIVVDIEKKRGSFEKSAGILNIGPATCMLNAELQRQILIFWKDFNYSYMRMWNIFSKNLIMSTENGKTLNYYFLDQVLDFFVNNGIPLFLDIGRMTEINRENEKSVLYKQETRLEFESEESWCEFLTQFLNHLSDRYGNCLIEKWVFEFSFFLNDRPYYKAESYQAKRAWEVSARCAKLVFPNVKIAGPGLLTGENIGLTEMIIHDFLSVKIKPDIFTSFHFPYVVVGKDNLLGELKKVVRTDFLKEKIEGIKEILKKEKFQGKFYVTDWNYSVSNRSYLEDSSFRAAFLIKNILQNRRRVDMLGIWYASDAISNYGDMSGPLIGGAGIMTVHGIKKPAYYALNMLEQLGTRIIAEGRNYIITQENEDSYQILSFHDVELGPKFFLTYENSQKPEEIYRLFEGNVRLNQDFCLENILDAKYSVSQTILNEDSGSVLKRWIELGAEKELSVKEREYLEFSSYPLMLREQILVNDKKLKLHISLKPNEVRLITIKKER